MGVLINRILLLAVIFSMYSLPIAKVGNDTIEIVMNEGLGKHQYFAGVRLKRMNDFTSIVAANSDSYKEYKKASGFNVVGQIFGVIGGALIGYPLGNRLAGGDAPWALVGIGGGFIAVGIPFSVVGSVKLRHSVSMFNDSVMHRIKNPESNRSNSHIHYSLIVDF